jgi:eukaryotic-like serine/threonine-protein kinase
MADEPGQSNLQKVEANNNSIAIGEININGTVTGNIHIGHTIIQAANARLRRDLGILLKNVETTWIKGVLEKSVHQAALLELGMEMREEAVDNPWQMVMEKPDQSKQEIPKGRKIKDIFDEANRLLLILGEPGSGKTTTLLQLARDLIADVGEAFTKSIPIILNLSTWTNKQQPLEEWLITEMNSKYRLPKKDGKRWLQDGRILPLLDGLDEVRAENRAACVEKINQLVTEYGLQGMVVCSRIKDYTALDVRLAFYRAIYIQPLTLEQVDEYLNQAGDRLASLRATLQADEALRGMAQSPLILNIMSLAYQYTSAEDLGDPFLNTDKARRKHLFDIYINRMFNRKVGGREFKDEQTRLRLVWLARNMQQHNQDTFLIEGLQPSWLLVHSWQLFYVLVSRLSFAPFFVLLLWIFPESLGKKIIAGLIVGLSLGFIDAFRFECLSKHLGPRTQPTFLWSFSNFIFVGLILALILSLVFVQYGGVYLIDLIFGLFGLRGSQQNFENDIQPVEALRWSWLKATKGALAGGSSGLVLGMLFMLATEPSYSRYLFLSDAFNFGLWTALILGLASAFLNGLHGEVIESKNLPNQGIRLSIRNTILVGLIVQTIGILISWPIVGEPFFSLFIGVVCFSWYGGLDVIQHYTLRFILVILGHTPTNYARFLDYAVDRIFLQKVGGGYRFIHRLLLEHFAEMYTEKT